MDRKSKVVTMCGSARFWDKMQEVSEKLELENKYVVNVNGDIGESVSQDIAYALATGKGVMYLEEKITLCGDNCLECPRYHAHTEEELSAVAELWYRVGWREKIVSNEEIACNGCSAQKDCTYQLVTCTKEHGVEKCNQCSEFPCGKIEDMLKRSAEYQKKCREVCSRQEYSMLEKAFFEKEENLKK